MVGVALISGGLDSAVMLRGLVDQNITVHPLFVAWGQFAVGPELEAATQLALTHNIPLHVIQIPALTPSALTPGVTDPITLAGGVASEFVPGRNTLLVMLAYQVAVGLKANSVYIGINNDDANAFPDCSSAWLSAMQAILGINNIALEGAYGPNVLAPLGYLTREGVREKAKAYGISGTFSCYFPKDDGSPCGVCRSCKK